MALNQGLPGLAYLVAGPHGLHLPPVLHSHLRYVDAKRMGGNKLLLLLGPGFETLVVWQLVVYMGRPIKAYMCADLCNLV